jgi:hypothetical protein
MARWKRPAALRGAGGTSLPAQVFEADVVMIPTGGEENGIFAVPLSNLEAQEAAVEAESALKVRHLEVNVPDTGLRMYTPFHPTSLPSDRLLRLHRNFTTVSGRPC